MGLIRKSLEWHKARQKTIGGSEVAAILGVNPYKSALQLYSEKVADEPIIFEGNNATDCGTLFESAIVEMYSLKTGRKVFRPKKSYIHDTYPFMVAQVDAATRKTPESEDMVRIVESKSTVSFVQKSWEDVIPPSYFCQLQYQLMCANRTHGDVALFVLDKRDLEIIPFQRDDEFCQIMTGKVIEFWNDNVLKRVPPPPATEEDMKQLFPAHEPGKVFYADYSQHEKYKRVMDIRRQMKDLKGEETEISLSFKKSMEDSEKMVYGEDVLCTWKEQTQSRFNQKAFQKNHADLFGEYKTESKTRKFLLKIRR